MTLCPLGLAIDFKARLTDEIHHLIGQTKSRELTEKIAVAFSFELPLFDGMLNHNLVTAISQLGELPFSFDFLAALLLKCLWRVIYYHIWLPRCQETIQKERTLGIDPKLKLQYSAPPTSNTPNSLALKFGISLSQDHSCWRSTFMG